MYGKDFTNTYTNYMKKSFTILALAAVTSAPVLAQDGPVRTDQDSKVIYFQDFEDSYESWSTHPSDSVVGMTYYNTKESPKPETIGSLSIYPTVRDTTLYLYDIVDTGGEEADFPDDYSELVNDKDDNSRRDEFDMFGADGGKQYLKYFAGVSNGATNGVQPNYRRNLDVRGIPIEENTSYRISMLLKVEPGGDAVPTFRADIRRGTTRCNSPLSMGYLNDAANYMYNNDFEFETTEFNEGWDRVSFMAYYTNDSIAQRFMYNGSYNESWGKFWSWKPDPVNSPKDSLMYVVQPNHYYLRLAFSTDQTIYSLDNLSLTKSWIGGVEHYKDMLRVDFGYDTNMDDLTAQAKEETNIAVVEVPGKYFTVWGYTKWGDWEEVPIQTAEYHGDGYMYMWTQPYESGGYSVDMLFDEYDSVLVSFTNPVDRPDLCLYYDGELFPKADDIEWIKNGKLIPGFTNEISIPNPHIVEGVSSLKNLPPVVQRLPYEDGSFGLDGTVREMKLRMSRKIAFDNKGESSKLAFLRVSKSGESEIWTVKSATDSTVVFERPAACKGELKGDYLFEFLNLTGKSSPSEKDYGDNVTCTWEFGSFDLNPSNDVVLKTDWRKEISSTDHRRIPTSVVLWNRSDGFNFGDGYTETDCGLFFVNNSSEFDCGLYVSALKEGDYDSNWDGHMFLGLVEPMKMKAGKYEVSYANCTYNAPVETNLYIFKYTRGSKTEDQVKDDIMALTAKDKIFIANYKATYSLSKTYVKTDKKWPEQFDRISYMFEVPEDGEYVFEMCIPKNKKGDGNIISNVTIKPVASISAPYVMAFNNALAAAKEKQAIAQANAKYQGPCLVGLGQIISKYEGWKSTAPSAYNKTTADINAGIDDITLRMQTVDLFLEHYGNVNDKLAEFEGTANKNLAAVQNLQKLYDDNTNYDFKAESATNDLLNEIIQSFDDGIDAIDARLELMDKWNEKIAEIKNVLADSLARTGYAEYGDLEIYYNTNKGNDIIAPSDEQMQQMYDAAYQAKNDYMFRCDLVDARTRQIKELFDLCKTLGDTFDGKEADLKEQIDALMVGDDKLEEMLRAEAIWQVNKAFAEKNPIVNGLDVSALVPNYYLYTTEKAFGYMKKNSSNMWILKEDNDEFYPHWSVTYKSGNSHPGTEAIDWEKDAHTYIAGHHLENSAVSSVGTVVEGLPVAFYNVRFDMEKIVGKSAYLRIYTDAQKFDIQLTKNSTGLQGQDSVLVSEGSTLAAKFDNTSASSSGTYHVNGLSLIITAPDASYNYTQAVTDAKSAYDQIKTFVGDVKSVDNVSYYGLNGVQMNAPKAGQIMIRKTTLENGRTTLEKVLVK